MLRMNEEVDKVNVANYRIEHFINCYIPIQIHDSICESLKKTMPKGAMSRVEVYEIEKL